MEIHRLWMQATIRSADTETETPRPVTQMPGSFYVSFKNDGKSTQPESSDSPDSLHNSGEGLGFYGHSPPDYAILGEELSEVFHLSLRRANVSDTSNLDNIMQPLPRGRNRFQLVVVKEACSEIK